MSDYQDYAEIIPRRLAQGSAPPTDVQGFSMVVLAAYEYQPEAKDFKHRPQIIHAPIRDDMVDGLNDLERQIVEAAADYVIDFLRVNKSALVLVTCAAGLNRSGVIVARMLVKLGATPLEAIRHIRKRRGMDALHNPRFVEYIKKGGQP